MLLGVIDEHAPREGPSAITAIPLTALKADPNHPAGGAASSPQRRGGRDWGQPALMISR